MPTRARVHLASSHQRVVEAKRAVGRVLAHADVRDVRTRACAEFATMAVEARAAFQAGALRRARSRESQASAAEPDANLHNDRGFGNALWGMSAFETPLPCGVAAAAYPPVPEGVPGPRGYTKALREEWRELAVVQESPDELPKGETLVTHLPCQVGNPGICRRARTAEYEDLLGLTRALTSKACGAREASPVLQLRSLFTGGRR